MEYDVLYISKLFCRTPDSIRKWSKENNVEKRYLNSRVQYVWTNKDIENYRIYLSKKYSNFKKKPFKKTENIYTLYKRKERAKKRNDTERLQEIEKEIEMYNNKKKSANEK